MQIEVSGTVDGDNWFTIPVRAINQVDVRYIPTIAGGPNGAWAGTCSQYKKIRARVVSYSTGTALVTLHCSIGVLDDSLNCKVSPFVVSATSSAGAALTATLPGLGQSLRHYITGITITRFATANLTASATPIVVTTTNLPGSMAFTLPADAANQGSVYNHIQSYPFPIPNNVTNAGTTIVAHATPYVKWRITVTYYTAP
jgi:hypothetical protein